MIMYRQMKRIMADVRPMLVATVVLVAHVMPIWASAAAQKPIAQAPSIGSARFQTTGVIEKYARFEIGFDVISTTATNPFFPYDAGPPPGVSPGAGISVDALLLAPGQSNWANSKVLPCFYYQPVQQLGIGSDVALLPAGKAEWRCRFTPDVVGTWQYKLRATDAGGTAESAIHQFSCINSSRKGFVSVSPTDTRFFEFSDGTPFVTPLINVEEGSPFNSLAGIRQNIQKMGQNGIRFVRWFPTGEGANYSVIPFGDSLRMSWRFGGSATGVDDVDTAAGKLFSFEPYYYSIQELPALPGARYRLNFRAKVVGEQVLRAEVNSARLDICSAISTYHAANGRIDTCNSKRDGWNDFSVTFVNSGNSSSVAARLRGLYVGADAPAPYNNAQTGKIRIHSIVLQRDESGSGGWGPTY